MKFKYKVLIVNIFLLSVALGVTGFFIVRNNFRIALDSCVENALIENTSIKTSLEYSILGLFNANSDATTSDVYDICSDFRSAILPSDTYLAILYRGQYLYSSYPFTDTIPYSIIKNPTNDKQSYVINQNKDCHFIYVSSPIYIFDMPMQVITCKNIESLYVLLKGQITFCRFLSLGIIVTEGILLYLLTTLLTKPLYKLNDISDDMADGNYKVRANVKSNDEIGQLAAKFNSMALAVDRHVNELQSEIKKREQFVADFTHEIKTPMTSIIGYADTIRSMDLSREEEISFANYIYSSARRLETMSHELIDLLYLNDHEIICSNIPAGVLFTDLSDHLAPSLSAKNITLKTEFDNAVLYVNKELFLTALINFTDNARKASYDNSVIELKGTVDGESYVITVTDHGIGIKEEYLEKICDEFFMIDKSRSRSEGSSGLGLSLASTIIRRHNGTLNITSAENVGTTVKVTVPLSDVNTRKEDSFDEEE